MGKAMYDPPTKAFPYKIRKRLNMLNVPKKNFLPTLEGMPTVNYTGVRKSALNGKATDRVNEISLPYLRMLLLTKRLYRKAFSKERMERIDKQIELSNSTCYSKLANCVIDLKNSSKDVKDPKKRKGWTDNEWKKHMEYIGHIAGPKRLFKLPPPDRGPRRKLADLLPRIAKMTEMPESKMYRRLSQENWYRDPLKVSEAAKKYVISNRILEMAKPKPIPQEKRLDF